MKWPRIAQQFARQIECAHRAGIFHAVCLGFGSVLAYCRDSGPNVNDDDDDLVIFSELITVEQEQAYLRMVQELSLIHI